jgi:GT2 family glycosyltransferase
MMTEASPAPLTSVLITTRNRQAILGTTFEALRRQDVAPSSYEVVAVDDGSTDGTHEVLLSMKLPCAYKVLKHEHNRGVAAGLNTVIREARGQYLISLSDDLVIPPNYISTMVATLEEFPGWWVVGGFKQLDELSATPFGRFLARLEEGFEEARKTRRLSEHLWELSYPTFRNLAVRRSELERVGPVDEQFPFCCEDQDLAERAMLLGIRFLYTTRVVCVHNDGSARLDLYCRSQERGAYSTVLFVAKYPEKHGNAAIVRVNGFLSEGDSPRLVVSKLVKSLLARPAPARVFDGAVSLAERLRFPDNVLNRLYRMRIGVSIFRGWRDGLRALRRRTEERSAASLGRHTAP